MSECSYAVEVTVQHIRLVSYALVRHWLFWKRLRTTVLAEVPYQVEVSDVVTLQERHAHDHVIHEVLVNDEVIIERGADEG